MSGQAGTLLLDLAAVDFREVAGGRDNRKDKAAVKMLMPAGTIQAELFQPRADVRTRHTLLVGQAQPERAVGEAKFKRRDGLDVFQPAFFQTGQRRWRLLQLLVI